jgi:CBS-domain-containing membrane protein
MKIATLTYIFWSWLGSFLGIFTLAILHQNMVFGKGNSMLVASFGAQAVLLHAAPQVPLAQPYNAIFGNTVSAVIGVMVKKYVSSDGIFMQAAQPALAVSLSICFMLATGFVPSLSLPLSFLVIYCIPTKKLVR